MLDLELSAFNVKPPYTMVGEIVRAAVLFRTAIFSLVISSIGGWGLNGILYPAYLCPPSALTLWREGTGHGWVHERREGGFAFYQPAIYAEEIRA